MQTPRDENRITTIMGVLNTDGSTLESICIDPSTHLLHISAGTDGSDFGFHSARRDENMVPVAMAVSSTDGITPVSLYVDSLCALLIQSS